MNVENGNVRFYEEDKYLKSEELVDSAALFVEKIKAFATDVGGMMDVMTKRAAEIELEKLKAIGQRNKVLCMGAYGDLFNDTLSST